MTRWFDNLKIKTKFLGPVAALILIGVLAIGLILFNISRINTAVKDVVREQKKLVHVQAGLIALLEQELVEKNYLLTGDSALTVVHTQLNEEAVFHFQTALTHVAGPDDQAAILKIMDDMGLYHNNYLQMVAFYEGGDRDAAIQLTLEVSDPAMAQTHREVVAIIENGKTMAEQQAEEAALMRTRAIIMSVTSVSLFLLVGITVFSLARRTTEPVLALTTAAAAVEAEQYETEVLSAVAERSDELGRLARVFQRMVQEIYRRETQLKQQVHQLRIEIDEAKRSQEVAEITGSDYFQDLQRKARELRQKANDGEERRS